MNGAMISECEFSSIHGGNFNFNGSTETVKVAGLLVKDHVKGLTIGTSLFFDNGNTTTDGSGIEINGDCSVICSGSSFGNPVTGGDPVMGYGVRSISGNITLIGNFYDSTYLPVAVFADGSVPSRFNEMWGSESGIQTLANSATPSVLTGNGTFLTGGTTTITNFTGGYAGKRITVLGAHSVTITHGTNMFMKAGTNFAMTANNSIEFVQRADGKWYEV